MCQGVWLCLLHPFPPPCSFYFSSTSLQDLRRTGELVIKKVISYTDETKKRWEHAGAEARKQLSLFDAKKLERILGQDFARIWTLQDLVLPEDPTNGPWLPGEGASTNAPLFSAPTSAARGAQPTIQTRIQNFFQPSSQLRKTSSDQPSLPVSAAPSKMTPESNQSGYHLAQRSAGFCSSPA